MKLEEKLTKISTEIEMIERENYDMYSELRVVIYNYQEYEEENESERINLISRIGHNNSTLVVLRQQERLLARSEYE